MSTGPGWRRAIPARLAYFDFFADFPFDFRRKGLCNVRPMIKKLLYYQPITRKYLPDYATQRVLRWRLEDGGQKRQKPGIIKVPFLLDTMCGDEG